jgi:hypothetical protein
MFAIEAPVTKAPATPLGNANRSASHCNDTSSKAAAIGEVHRKWAF